MNNKPTLAEALKLAREKAIDTARLEYALESRVMGRIRERKEDPASDPMSLTGWLGLQMASVSGLIAVALFAGYEFQAQQLAQTSFQMLSGDTTSWLF